MMSCHVHLHGPSEAQPGPATADLRHEHEVILWALTILERIGERLASGRAVSDSALADLVQFLRTFADRCHHGKEEDYLLPALQAKGAGSILTVFLEEHEEGREYLRTLASAAAAPERAAAARRYVGMLRDHIQRENEVLFPMADQLLDAADHAALARAYREVELRVLGPTGHEPLLSALARLDAGLGPMESAS